MRAAAALLDAGASPNSGWFEKNHQPKPVWESVLYGAAGVAHHEGLTRLLLERGADPNDGETPYHAPESDEMGVLKALVESGKLNEDSLATILLRKADWHHYEAIKWLLEQGVDPNLMTHWGKTALTQRAAQRQRARDHRGAARSRSRPDAPGRFGPWPTRAIHLVGCASRARGRSDVLDLLERRGIRASS